MTGKMRAMKNKTPFSGILLVDKPAGMTSHDVVGRIRRLYNTREVGHTGTLDPMATGLLVVLVGRAVKASDMIVSNAKRYVAGLTLGITTDTEDMSGTVLTESDRIPDEGAVLTVIEGFLGESEQVPPMYSALKVGGKKLVDLAREGKVIERAARPITVYDMTAERIDERRYTLTVHCSKGTYIRTLCADIGAKLGCGGAMHALRRIESGSFTLGEAYTLEALEAMDEAARLSLLRPVEEVFSDLETLHLPKFYETLSKNGCEIYQKKVGTSYPDGTRLRLYDEGGFYAIAEVRQYPDGSAIKAIKRFDVQ